MMQCKHIRRGKKKKENLLETFHGLSKAGCAINQWLHGASELTVRGSICLLHSRFWLAAPLKRPEAFNS